MSNTVNLGNGKWAIKDSELLGYSLTDDAELIALTLDVSRASSGTRVNASGLIETVEEILSGDKVTNGDFSNGTTDWSNPSYGGNNSATISIDNGSLKVQKDNNLDWRSAFVSQDLINYTFGKEYKVQFSLKDGNTNGGEVFVRSLFDSSNSAIVEKTLTDDWVQYTEYFTPDRGDSISFGVVEWHEAGSGQYYFIDNVSVIEVNRDNLARIDYTDSTDGVLLTEPQSTNLANDSINLLSWGTPFEGTGSKAIVTSNFAISPDGTQNADKVVFNINGGTTSSDYSQIQINAGTRTGDFTNSVYIKSNTADSYQVVLGDPLGGPVLKTVTPEWSRFDATSMGVSSQTTSLRIRLRGHESTSQYADISVWGAQIEELPYATSYMPTYGEIASRAADVINNGGEAINFNSEEGTLFAEVAALANDGTDRYISLNNGGTTDYLFFRYRNDNQFQIRYRSNNVDSVNTTFSLSNNLDFNKIAFSYKLNEFKIFINGSQIGSTVASGNVFNTSINTLDLARFDGGSQLPFYGKTKNIQVFKEALTDAQLLTLTTI